MGGEFAEASEPTELAGIADADTMSAYAWSMEKEAEGDSSAIPMGSPNRPFWITSIAVGVSLALVTLAAVLAYRHIGSARSTPVAAPTPPVAEPSPPQPAAAPPPVQHSTPTKTVQSASPAVVALPTRGGSVFVRTRSGKTVCQMSAGDVRCNVDFLRPTPILNGLPATGVMTTARGSWQWLVGDPGDPEYQILGYGTTYRALGWTITPTSEGTTFINDATGHGMTVSVEGFTPF
ncbi:hypothetical protein VC60_gp38 [Mycobacterium phage Sbash]|uniref:Uncharacterized protein n=1 Tax=Mycobacterium phage Sbash TaxID=1567475 RepID=A0A0A7RVN9_9CAUD|nr:hypothetical protein VC60_gp38 [Mycobacterium phage Sbash]AJA43339.1 hypothetical protein PBI_SBASH_38 [Mycobacterium phage Sbash]